ncbi:COX15/CtaA family protein [Herbidospora cretacea]|uniref:COX15/CtaA family protein n=1 Tax=Herbidospora cretacea TaxID=28444 RepID=UPI000B2A6186|nr:COX15/CtaA family protein [Herbidospora cretacea]
MKRLLSSIWTPAARDMRAWALAAVVVNAGITVTGAAVRLTGSGLGCPTWPRCTADSFVPVPHPDHSPINTAIEFGNRMFSLLVLAVAIAVFLAAWRLRRRSLIPLALVQPLGVIFQALWGGLVVRTALNPVTVSVHFLVSIGMIAAAYMLFARSAEGDGPVVPLVHPWIVTLGRVLTGAMLVLLVAGVVTTGTGPHSGDERASRFDFDIEVVARIHADVVWVVVGLTFALLFALYLTKAPERARKAALILFAVEIAQGVIGYVQYFLAVPALLVGFHVLGAALVWIATLHVVHTLRERTEITAFANHETVARV